MSDIKMRAPNDAPSGYNPTYLLLGLLLAFLITPSSHAQCRYSWEIITGGPCDSSGPESFNGRVLDEAGNAAGWNKCVLSLQASFWAGSGESIKLTGPAGISESKVFGMTDLNHIVGQSNVIGNSNQPIATVWENGQGVLLPLLPGANTSTASGINSSLQIAGGMNNTIFGPLAAFRKDDAILHVLQLPVGPNSTANDINDPGQITGWMGSSDVSDAHAYIWDDGVVLDLGIIPGGTTAEGMAINNLGHVAGRGRTPDGVTTFGKPHAWFWDGQTMIRLPELPDHTESHALDLNDADQIVGISRGENSNESVLWQDGQVYRLLDLLEPSLGSGITEAYAINNMGQILIDAGTAVLLTPIDSRPGDVDHNCKVDVDDLLRLLTEWGNTLSIADVNADGIVDVEDLLTLLANWG